MLVEWILFGICLCCLGLLFYKITQWFPYRLEGKNKNKIRPLGFVCDRCNGKFDKKGNKKIRCRVKQWILTKCGVNVYQKEIPRQDSEWWLG